MASLSEFMKNIQAGNVEESEKLLGSLEDRARKARKRLSDASAFTSGLEVKKLRAAKRDLKTARLAFRQSRRNAGNAFKELAGLSEELVSNPGLDFSEFSKKLEGKFLTAREQDQASSAIARARARQSQVISARSAPGRMGRIKTR